MYLEPLPTSQFKIADFHIFVKLVFPSRCTVVVVRSNFFFFLSLPHHTILLPSSKWRYYNGAHETFLSRLINNVYIRCRGEFSTACRILRSTLPGGRRVHAAGSLMEDVIGKYLARLRSIHRRVCSRYATNRVIARILLLSAL